MNSRGLLTCAAYAFPPNSLHYCGGEKQQTLIAYQQEQIADLGLVEIIRDFQTLYPYLTLIAYENGIPDPFDPRVVEAYWVGNDLLKRIKIRNFYHHLHDSLELKKKVKPKDLELLYGKLPTGLLPHHTFHVLNVFIRTGHQALEHTLETMDACRIGWGRIIIQNANLKSQNDNAKYNMANKIAVETQPLILQNGKLALGKPIIKQISVPFIHKSKIINHRSLVSFHWNTFCEFLSLKQVRHLTRYTEEAIRLANQTL